LNFFIQQPQAFKVEAEINSVSCHGYADGSIQLQSVVAFHPYSIFWNNGMQGTLING
jgi:hypothetical protein